MANDRIIFLKIRDALGCRRAPGSVAQQPKIAAALDAIARETGTNREEIIYRAIRVYLNAYLHTHTESWFHPDC